MKFYCVLVGDIYFYFERKYIESRDFMNNPSQRFSPMQGMRAPKTSFKFSLFGIFRRREREFIDGWKEQISFRFNTFIFIQMYGYKKGKVNVEQILQKHLASD